MKLILKNKEEIDEYPRIQACTHEDKLIITADVIYRKKLLTELKDETWLEASLVITKEKLQAILSEL
jgi:hypothetical protein